MSRSDAADEGESGSTSGEWRRRHGRTRATPGCERVVESGADEAWQRRHAECRKGQ